MKRHGRRGAGKGLVLLLVCTVLAVVIGGGVSLWLIRLSDQTAWEAELASYPTPYGDAVKKASDAYGVPPEIIYSVMRTESGFDADITSRAGAVGLMQIMPVTLEWIGFLRGETYDTARLTEPEFSIDCGTFLLGWLYERYENWNTSFAAYNAGYARVNGWLEDESLSHDGILDTIPVGETKAYVEAIGEALTHYRALYVSENGTLTAKSYRQRQAETE